MAWIDLIIAVLKQAARDYESALKRNNFAKINQLEEFFLSDYGQALSRNTGEKIIAQCQRNVRKEKEKRKKK